MTIKKNSLLIFLLLILFSANTDAQYIKGMHFINLGAIQFNQENKERDSYLPFQVITFVDSTHSDTTLYVGKNKSDLTVAYHVAVTNNLVIGVTSRFLQSEESSYYIRSGGLSARYAFPITLIKEPNSQFVLSKDETVVRNFFFVDYTFLVGRLNYDQYASIYLSHSLQFGISFRMPTPTYKFVRHFGIEISGGLNFRTQPYNQNGFFPIAAVGIQYYLDRKYTKIVEVKKD